MLNQVPQSTEEDELPWTVTVGSVNLSISSQYQRVMNNTDLSCCNFGNATNVSGFEQCQSLCDSDEKCHAWTFRAGAVRLHVCMYVHHIETYKHIKHILMHTH